MTLREAIALIYDDDASECDHGMLRQILDHGESVTDEDRDRLCEMLASAADYEIISVTHAELIALQAEARKA